MLGDSFVIVGTSAFVKTPNRSVLDTAVEGEVFTTVMRTLPGVAKSRDDTAASSVLALNSEVGRAAPSQYTFELELKFVPSTVRVMAGAPALAELGINDAIVGTPSAVIRKVNVSEVPPADAELNTSRLAVPAAAMSVDEMEACSSVDLMNVVGRGDPFHLTIELSASK